MIEHVAIDVRPGVVMESQSGLQNLRPRVFGAFAGAAGSKVGAILMHPTSNYMGHYLLAPLAERGVNCLALNSRYVGNDALLEMERVIIDLGAGIKEMQARGIEKVFLIGNSGGASLAAFYQSQAERLTAHQFVDGDATGLSANDLPLAAGIILSAAHLGRAKIFSEWIDPSLVDESDPDTTDLSLDLYDGSVQPPYSPEFLARFRDAQLLRRDHVERIVFARLEALRRTQGAPRDRFFIIHRTHADPRFLDLSLDANDRAAGSVWGDPRVVNLAANSFGRLTSYRAFLSQLSSRSKARGPDNLAETSVNVLLMVHTADQSTYPSTRDAWMASAPGRITQVDVERGDHYLVRQPDLVAFSADTIADWIKTQAR